MGFRFVSGKWQLFAAVMVAPAMAFGYYAGDPENLGITVNATLSGAGSVHGKQIPSSGTNTKRRKISREAVHLFTAPYKGPRADRYVMLTRSGKGQKTQPKLAMASVISSAPVKADMMVTGSIPKERPKKRTASANRTSESWNPESADSAGEFGLLPSAPAAERTTASLFLSSMQSTKIPQFPEFASISKEPQLDLRSAQKKISRGLTFKGETETEYQVRQRRCLATAIYFEARGEPTRGQLAVAQVVMNRVRSTIYPDTICGVVYQGQWRRTGCQFSFTCDRRADIPREKGKWLQANLLARQVTDGKSWLGDIGYATNYHANYVKPRWRRNMNRIKQVGKHIFYRVKGKQIDDVLSTEESPARGLALSGSG